MSEPEIPLKLRLLDQALAKLEEVPAASAIIAGSVEVFRAGLEQWQMDPAGVMSAADHWQHIQSELNKFAWEMEDLIDTLLNYWRGDAATHFQSYISKKLQPQMRDTIGEIGQVKGRVYDAAGELNRLITMINQACDNILIDVEHVLTEGLLGAAGPAGLPAAIAGDLIQICHRLNDLEYEENNGLGELERIARGFTLTDTDVPQPPGDVGVPGDEDPSGKRGWQPE